MEGYGRSGTAVGVVIGGVTFLGCWGYCIAAYGFLLGVGLGWIPSMIVAVVTGFIAGALWPLIVIVVALIVLVLARAYSV